MKPIRVPIIGDDRLSHVLKGINKNITTFGREAMAVGTKLTAAISLPILALTAYGIKSSTELNKSLANVSSLMDGSIGQVTARIGKYKTEVRGIAIETAKATADISEGLYQVISAFGETADSIKITKINAIAAAAGVATTLDAINLTSAVTKAYGDTSAQAVQKVSDLSFQTVKLGQTTFPELASSIQAVTPISAELGVKMEELFGTLATATGVTGGASEVSTQLRGVLASMMSPTERMTQLYEHLGVQSGKAMIAKYGLQKSISLIISKAKEADVPLKDLIGRVEGQTLALALSGPQADTFSQKLKAMENAAGATDDAFKKQTEGVNKAGFAWEQTKVKMTIMAQKLGDFVSPVILKGSEVVGKLFDSLEKLPRPVKIASVVIAGFAAVIPPIVLGIGMVATAIGALTAPVWGTIGIVAGVAIALGALVTLIIVKWSSIKTFFSNMFAFLAKLWHSRITAILMYTNPLTAAARLIINNWGPIKNFFIEMFHALKYTFNKFGEWVGGWAEKISNLPFIKALTGVAGSVGGAAGKWLFGSADEKAFFAPGIAASAQEVRKTEITKKESRVDFYFHNAPKGTHVKQVGAGYMQSELGLIYGGVQ